MSAKASQPGSALILTMFIMAGMLIVAASGAYIVLLGIRSGGIQAQSMKAYFAAEAGSERLLWELRQNGYAYTSPDIDPVFTGNLSSSASYEVFFTRLSPLIFSSVGDFQNNKRSVELKM
jgi:hypothetical protein